MSIVLRPLTYDDLSQMPDDGKRYEIIGGELFVAPSPIKKHQKLAMRLADLLYDQQLAGHGEAYFAPVDVRLSPHDIVQPDLLFILRDRLDIYLPNGVVEGPPDIVVEILSPSTRGIDQIRKAALYARGGVREYWIADPDAPFLTVYSLRDGVYEAVSHQDRMQPSLVLQDLAIDLDALFTGLD